MHSFQIKHTPDLARRIYWKLSRERAGGYHIGAVIVVVISLIGTIAGNTPWLFGFGVGVCSMYFYKLWVEIRDVGAKAGDRVFSVKLGNEGFAQESDGKSTLIGWHCVSELLKMKDVWVLLSKDGAHYTAFPIKDISPDALKFMETRVVEHSGRVTDKT